MPSPIMHPPRGCPNLRSLWSQWFADVLDHLGTYDPADVLTTQQAARAILSEPSVLFSLARADMRAGPADRTGPPFVVPDAADRTFRPARAYRVSDLVAWVQNMQAQQATPWGERIGGDQRDTGLIRSRRKPRGSRDLRTLLGSSREQQNRAEALAARFLLRTGADLVDTLAGQIAEQVARRIAAAAVADERAARTSEDDAAGPIADGMIRPRDNVPDAGWPLSDPRVSGRTCSAAQFRVALRALGMNPGQFSAFWGVSSRTAYAWSGGTITVPIAVADYLRLVVGQFVRLRCAQVGVPIPNVDLNPVDMPTGAAALRALDTLRGMLADRDPEGRGYVTGERRRPDLHGRLPEGAAAPEDAPPD